MDNLHPIIAAALAPFRLDPHVSDDRVPIFIPGDLEGLIAESRDYPTAPGWAYLTRTDAYRMLADLEFDGADIANGKRDEPARVAVLYLISALRRALSLPELA